MEIRTKQLILRSFSSHDASAFSELAGDRLISDTMISIPHPLPPGFAHEWVTLAHPTRFAICEAVTGALTGSAELRDLEEEHNRMELSFWIGTPFRGRGFATEAAGQLVALAFDTLGINRVQAFHMVRNPASGRVLAKTGFHREGCLRQYVRKWCRFEDVVIWSILKSERAT